MFAVLPLCPARCVAGIFVARAHLEESYIGVGSGFDGEFSLREFRCPKWVLQIGEARSLVGMRLGKRVIS